MLKFKERILNFLQLPLTLLDPPAREVNATITELSPLVQFSQFDYKNKTLSFYQRTFKPTLTSALFGVQKAEAGLSVESVAQAQQVDQDQVIQFKASKSYSNKSASIVALMHHPGALHVNQQIQFIRLQKQVIEEKHYVKFNSKWYEMLPIYGKEQNEQTISEENDQCCICLGCAPRVFALPCRHLICCNECAENYRSRNTVCPLCRQEIYMLVSLGDSESQVEEV